MTKKQALELFCKFNFYEDSKLEDESKEDFLERKKSEWALKCVRFQIEKDRIEAQQQEIEDNLEGLDL